MIKGAFVQLVSGLGAPLPNIVIFQFNPETLQHQWSQALPGAKADSGATSGGHPLAVSGPPRESYSFTLMMDVADQATDPDQNVRTLAEEFGIHPRLAALELLLQPEPIEALSGSRSTPSALLPTVLFVWGKNRIVPVRITGLTFTEKLYDAKLNPTHAEARIELTVLNEDDLASISSATADLARTAAKAAQALRLTLAAVNLGETARAAIGMTLPQPPST